ncbi:NAD-dependent epimerase/dehydratase family protein [Microlunatus ginsengisoli]|uniref:NAD-dependent epimerase/dehydratase family protein n=1 Tax=Microlunatus ginsengisoli TaxID=363863 RepID=A0ABP6ZKT4_9ACTN
MRVLLTGGAGFIGRAVRRRLTAGGAEIRVYDSALDPADDVLDLDRLRRASQGCAVTIHLAAKVGLGVGVSDIDDYARQNSLGTAVVLRAAAEAAVRRIVYASSMVIYGEGGYRCPTHGRVRPGPRREADLLAGRFEPPCPRCGSFLTPVLVDEDAVPDPRNAYAATKLHGEHLGATWCRETGGRLAALRFHNVYGPGLPRDTPYAGVAALFVAQAAAGRSPEVFEDGQQRRDFVHVDDVAAAVVAATGANLPDGMTALNVGSGTITTVGEMASTIAGALSAPAPVVTGRYRLGDVRHITADSARARALLGWQPEHTLADGVRDLVAESSVGSR